MYFAITLSKLHACMNFSLKHLASGMLGGGGFHKLELLSLLLFLTRSFTTKNSHISRCVYVPISDMHGVSDT